MPKPAEVIKIKPRKCKYCKLIFVPVCKNEQQRKNAEAQQFCSSNHRKAYHRNGGINFEQLVEKVRAALTKDATFRAWLTAEIERFKDCRIPLDMTAMKHSLASATRQAPSSAHATE